MRRQLVYSESEDSRERQISAAQSSQREIDHGLGDEQYIPRVCGGLQSVPQPAAARRVVCRVHPNFQRTHDRRTVVVEPIRNVRKFEIDEAEQRDDVRAASSQAQHSDGPVESE